MTAALAMREGQVSRSPGPTAVRSSSTKWRFALEDTESLGYDWERIRSGSAVTEPGDLGRTPKVPSRPGGDAVSKVVETTKCPHLNPSS
jgi:hypothetical protein